MSEKKAKVIDKGRVKYFVSDEYNYKFDRINGDLIRWGKTLDDDPDFCPFGPEILDIEISAVEPGEGDVSCNGHCSFCVPPGTMIHTSETDTKAIEDISVGDNVVSYNESTDSFVKNNVEETYIREYDGVLICIKTIDGSELKLTPNHEVYTSNRGWIKAEELEVTDDIILVQ